MCMTFGYNPQINFYHLFHSLNLVIFWAQLLLKLMDIRYLVSATPPTIFSSPVQSTGRAIVVTLASVLLLPFPSRHF